VAPDTELPSILPSGICCSSLSMNELVYRGAARISPRSCHISMSRKSSRCKRRQRPCGVPSRQKEQARLLYHRRVSRLSQRDGPPAMAKGPRSSLSFYAATSFHFHPNVALCQHLNWVLAQIPSTRAVPTYIWHLIHPCG
jgi:hypothetical protein